LAPFRTIERALNVATSPGSKIYVRAGTYGAGDSSEYVWSSRGTAAAPITLAAAPGATPVIAKLFVLSGAYLRLSGFKIVRNSYPTDTRFGQSGSSPGGNVGHWVNNCSSCQVDHSEITQQTQSGLFISGSPNVQILKNWIHNNGTTHDDHGIYYCSGASGIIADNVIAANYDYGLQLYCGATYPIGAIITENTIVHNGTVGSGGSGMVLQGSNVQVWNNIVAFNVDFGIRGWAGGSGTITSNDVYGNGGGAFYDLTDTYSVASTILTDPRFVDNAAGNYHLQSSSPAVGIAAAPYAYSTDRDDIDRPQGSAPDLGSYEAL
jgi:hypothetical protein